MKSFEIKVKTVIQGWTNVHATTLKEAKKKALRVAEQGKLQWQEETNEVVEVQEN